MSTIGPRSDFDLVEDFWDSLLALDERRVARAMRRVARRRTMRTLAFAVLALLAAAAIAIAARTILFGSAAPAQLAAGQAALGRQVPGTRHLLPLQAADPVGGPAWGIRVFTTERHGDCFQVGRVVAGRLVALGVAGAFNDDGKAHPLKVEAEGCGGRRGGPANFGGVSQVTNTSGLIGASNCLSPEQLRRLEHAVRDARQDLVNAVRRPALSAVAHARRDLALALNHQREAPPECPPSTQRTILVGPVPAGTTSVVLVGPHTHVDATSADGVYLLVLAGSGLPNGAVLYGESADGQQCLVPTPLESFRLNLVRSPHQRLCDRRASSRRASGR